MPPRAKRAQAWSNGELLDLISVWGEEAVQSQLRSSCRNYDTFGKVSKDMMERGHDRDALQCRIKVKELRSAYCKARDANGRSGAPPATCRFYKELDAILGVNPTSTLSTTMDTSEPVWGGEEEEENGSDGGGPDGDTLEPCSQELFSSQEEGIQSQRPVLGGGQTDEHVPAASTLRPQPSLLSPAQRLQRLRKRPRKSKEDMLQEVMQQSIKENEKAQDWREKESSICQENAAHRQQSIAHWQQSTDRLISILERQADAIQELVAMQKEEQYRKLHPPTALVPKLFPLCPTVTSNPLSSTSVFFTPPAASNTSIFTTQP
ncbi:zinc finger and SCAN domain-containing protein 29-like [Chrysemys picta bellii]|uniref:zinc finger and SCAN domain-containing protein 29-like n=1 Tax=Chrysemys picta bellii TaxID=8478 RepID=UPI0032B0F80E